MLPDGWNTHLLGELMSFRNGLNFTPNGIGEEIKLVGVADFKSLNVLRDTASLQQIKVAGRVADADLLATGDLLFVRSNGNKALIGRCLHFPEVTERLAFSGFTIRARVDRDRLDPEFASYLMCSSSVSAQMHQGGSGTNISNLSQEILQGIRVAMPELAEQRRITAVLRLWDQALNVAEKQLANSQAQKSALLSKLLMPVPARARGRVAGEGYPLSVQHGIPRLPPAAPGWRQTTLAEQLTEMVRPAALSAQASYTLVTVRRSRGGVDKRSVLLGSQIKTPTQFYVKSGDFLISKRQIVHGACGIVPDHLDGAVVSNEYAVLNTAEGLDTRFLAYLAETTYFQQTCFHSSIGVHIEKMLFQLERWLSWPINIPTLATQHRIVEQLDLATEGVRLAERQIHLLRAERRALMADLLTGKRRVQPREGAAPPQETS